MSAGSGGDDDPHASVGPSDESPRPADDAGLAIAGRVVDAQGIPVRGATVSIVRSPAGHADIAALTDQDGAFSLPAQDAGDYLLEARPRGAPPHRAHVFVSEAAAAEIEIRLPP